MGGGFIGHFIGLGFQSFLKILVSVNAQYFLLNPNAVFDDPLLVVHLGKTSIVGFVIALNAAVFQDI